jgi:hypothetical protein
VTDQSDKKQDMMGQQGKKLGNLCSAPPCWIALQANKVEDAIE